MSSNKNDNEKMLDEANVPVLNETKGRKECALLPKNKQNDTVDNNNNNKSEGNNKEKDKKTSRFETYKRKKEEEQFK